MAGMSTNAAALGKLVSMLNQLASPSHQNAANTKTAAGGTSLRSIDLSKLGKVIEAVAKRDVLVGYPHESSARKDGEAMNNAARAYILNYGSQAAHIPAREFMGSGIVDIMPRAGKTMELAVRRATQKLDVTELDKALTRVGIMATNSIKRKIQSNLPPPLSVFTVMWRHVERGGRMRKTEETYVHLVGMGYSPAQAQAATGIKSLVNTGEMRDATTFVLRKR
jgi:hypothetical protein